MNRRLGLAVLTLLAMVGSGVSGCSGCSSSSGPVSAGGDGGDDGGEIDASVDTGPGTDGTAPDSGTTDSGTGDATAADSSPAADSAAVDSGTADVSDGGSGCTEAGASCGTGQVCSPGGQCIACTEGAACTSDAGTAGACQAYAVSCAGGVVTCALVNDAEGTTCGGGGSSCTHGVCSADVTLAVDGGVINMSTVEVTPGRTCPDSTFYSVAGVTSTSSTLSVTPGAGCIAAGDEVLLINLQGTATSTVNVGVYETLLAQSAIGTTVTFTTPKARFYGQDAGDDTNIGTGAGQQKVALVRVARFGALTISSGTTLTAQAWNGLTGGVVVVRANQLTLGGTLAATALGYLDGRWSQDDACTVSIQTESGESIDGPGTSTSVANVGGSGGLGAGTDSFYGNNALGASAGHATAGQPGGDGQDRTLGAPGGAYGVGDGTNLTMGSGGGGALTCATGVPSTTLVSDGAAAGGIVLVLGGNVTVSPSGSIDANGYSQPRCASSGGYVLVRGNVVSLGTSLVTAQGGIAVAGPSAAPITNVASSGYVAVLYGTSVTGTTLPAAFTQQVANP